MIDNKQFIKNVQEWGDAPDGYYKFNWDTLLYFICDENANYLKIGISKEPKYRIKALQTGNPINLVLLLNFHATQTIEIRLHNYLKKYNLSGEWYPLIGKNGNKVSVILRELCLGYFCGMNMPSFNSIYGVLE